MKRITQILGMSLLLACSTAVNAAPIAADTGNTYKDTALGIEITKPADWHFMPTASIGANRGNIRLKDKELTAALWQRSNLPVAVIAKYSQPEKRLGITPTVQVVISPKPSDPDLTAEKLSWTLVGMLETGTADFELITPVTTTTINGLPAAKAAFSYTLSTPSGASFDVKSVSYIIVRGDIVISVGMAGPLAGEDQADTEFSQIITSLKIDN